MLGNLLDIRKEGLLGFLERGRRQYGDVYRVCLGPKPAVVVSHPDAFERVLAGHKRNYFKGGLYKPARELMGQSLITLEGKLWRKRRRMAQPFFHRSAMVQMFDTMVDAIDARLNSLQSAYPQGGEIDIASEMVEVALDVLCAALFGLVSSPINSVSHETLASSIELMEARTRHPFPLWLPTRTNRWFLRSIREIDTLIYGIIASSRSRHREDGHNSSLLDMLLNVVDEEGEHLSDVELRDEVVGLFLAGHETVALTMTWLFALLDGNEGVMNALKAESENVYGSRRPALEDMSRLTYTKQSLDETLRLRTPGAYLPRSVRREDNLCGYRIDPKDNVLLFYWGLHHHQDYWPNPEVFEPSRFDSTRVAERDSWCYLPFSGGPRTCIGSNLALLEAQLATSMMMRRARWRVLPEQDFRPRALGTLRPAGPVMVRFDWS